MYTDNTPFKEMNSQASSDLSEPALSSASQLFSEDITFHLLLLLVIIIMLEIWW